MSDGFQKVTPGMPFRPDPQLHNATIDVVNAVRAQNGEAGRDAKPRSSVRFVNRRGATIPRFGVIGLGTIAIQGGKQQAANEVLVESAAPAVEPAVFAITQRETRDDWTAEAVIAGVTKATVNVTNSTHGYAGASAGQYSYLTSQSDVGPAKILWGIPAPTTLDGAIDASVTTLDVADGDSFPEAPFVVLIGTEQINVTATSDDGLTWTVTRGHNSTTPASHSDGAAVSFRSGIVLVVVLLDPNASGGGGTNAGGDLHTYRENATGLGNYYPSGIITGNFPEYIAANNIIHATALIIPHRMQVTEIAVWLQAQGPDDTSLSADIDDSVTTINVNSYNSWPNVPFVVLIDSEELNVTAVAGTVWTVTRGHNSTTPDSHIDTAAVTYVPVGGGENCRLAIYDSASNSNIYPRYLVAQSDELPTNVSSGYLTATLTDVYLEPGLYWLCYISNGAAIIAGTSDVYMWPIFGVSDTAFEQLFGVKLSHTYGSFPSNFPSSSAGVDNGEFIIVLAKLVSA